MVKQRLQPRITNSLSRITIDRRMSNSAFQGWVFQKEGSMRDTAAFLVILTTKDIRVQL